MNQPPRSSGPSRDAQQPNTPEPGDRQHAGSGSTNPIESALSALNPEPELPARRDGLGLLFRMLAYHLVLLLLVMGLSVLYPEFVDVLPIGGVTELVEGGELKVLMDRDPPMVDEDVEIVTTVINAAGKFDRLGYARQLAITLLGLWLLMLPVSWVHKGIHRISSHDHSLDETMLILPGVVAAIVLVVQHSLALAFSLAGIVAGVQFRRALQDTFDALFILVAIGTGIAAGVKALEIAAVLTVFFSYATLYVYYCGDGLESDYATRRKLLKRLRKTTEQSADETNG